MKFSELGLNDAMLKAVEDNGYKTPSAIQAKTIPLILKDQDVIGQAQTGTGKTAAFSLPILQKLDAKSTDIQALIVSPTRELAMQTQRAVSHLAGPTHAKVQSVYGGSPMGKQLRALKQHPQIIVGTPGRIIDLMNRKALRFEHLKTLVLDEADDMLNMGFLPDIKKIAGQMPAGHQTLLFSATMPKAIEKVGVQFMHDPEKIAIKSKTLTTALIDQYYVMVHPREKFEILTRFFDIQKPQITIVFCETKRRVTEVAQALKECGFKAEGLQGDLSQYQRSRVMKDFKLHKINVLVATDVAARGIDVGGITQVYNFDLPQDHDEYVHRIGRTGRAGHHGISITMIEPRERRDLRDIERLTKVKMEKLRQPTKQEALKGQLDRAGKEIDQIVKHKSLVPYAEAAQDLLKKYNANALVSILLEEMTDHTPQIKSIADRPKGQGHHFGGHRGHGHGGFHRGGRGHFGHGGGHRGGFHGRDHGRGGHRSFSHGYGNGNQHDHRDSHMPNRSFKIKKINH